MFLIDEKHADQLANNIGIFASLCNIGFSSDNENLITRCGFGPDDLTFKTVQNRPERGGDLTDWVCLPNQTRFWFQFPAVS